MRKCLTSDFIYVKYEFMAWLIVTKLEMTRVIKDDKFIPVTLLKVPELRIIWFKTLEKDWYEAIIIWILKEEKEGVLKEWKTTLSKNEFSEVKEFPISKNEAWKYVVWQKIGLESIEVWNEVEIEWFSKWKWFAWAMKKHNFHWGPGWHGSKFHRALWSIGTRKPRRTHKGKRMHGHLWDVKVTIKKVPIELINEEMSVIWVRGWVPGGRNSIINIILN